MPSSRRPTIARLRVLKALALSVAAVAVCAAAGCGGSGSSPRGAGVHGDPQSIFEDELHLHSDPAGTLELMRRLGVDRVRVYVPWQSIAPSPTAHRPPAGFRPGDPAAYPATSWAIYDTIVQDAAARGVGLDMTVGGPVPAWALGPGAPPNPFRSWKPSDRLFGAFVHAVAARYSGSYKPPGASQPLPRVNFWSIWNEPNYGPGLAPQATDNSTVEVSPRLYRGLLDAAWSALQQTGHGGDTILIGETAPRGNTTGNAPGNFQGMVPLRFVRALYCVDSSFHRLRGTAARARGCPTDAAASAQFPARHPALFRASGFADHPYPQGGIPPNVRTPDEPDYADLAAIPNLISTLDRAQASYGAHPHLPIFSTEFGYQTNPPEKIVHTTSPQVAAGYLNWAEYISWRNPRISSYDQYLLTDPPGANASGGFATGLEFANGTPKATYAAFRMPIYLPKVSIGHGQRAEVWGCVRPAGYAQRSTGRAQSARIEFQTGAGAFRTLKTVTITSPHGYFDTLVNVPQTGAVRISWTYPHGQVIHSRAIRITVR